MDLQPPWAKSSQCPCENLQVLLFLGRFLQSESGRKILLAC